MRISVLGTGIVGSVIASKLNEKGHDVFMGSRTADNESAIAWLESQDGKGNIGTFEEAAWHGDLLFNCTKGSASLEALRLCGEKNLEGKVLVDLANPLHFTDDMQLYLDPVNTDSLGEQIQREFPACKVVKALNTLNCNLMVNPGLLKERHDLFICGNDAEGKDTVTAILKGDFGWESVIDLGDIRSARSMEMMLPLWIKLWGKYNDATFNYRIVRE